MKECFASIPAVACFVSGTCSPFVRVPGTHHTPQIDLCILVLRVFGETSIFPLSHTAARTVKKIATAASFGFLPLTFSSLLLHRGAEFSQQEFFFLHYPASIKKPHLPSLQGGTPPYNPTENQLLPCWEQANFPLRKNSRYYVFLRKIWC